MDTTEVQPEPLGKNGIKTMEHYQQLIPGQLLADLELAELLHLSDWCATRRVLNQFETFNRWLWLALEAEKDRRDSVGVNPSDVALPWDTQFLADALPASYALSRLPLTDRLAAFVDELARHVVCASSAVLDELTIAVTK